MSIDLSLARMADLLPHLPYTRPTIHIAGTNGKGSVSALVASIFSRAESTPPLSVGRFNSPHLVHITDCILVNDKPVDHQIYLDTTKSVVEADAKHGGDSRLTPFEVLTLTALQVFEKARVDVAVIEVGMGGITDATNIIPSKYILASALTQVDLDHQGFLGNTIAEIATKKAGIARQGKPFVLGFQRPENRKDVHAAVHAVVTGVGAALVDAVEVRKCPQEPSKGFRPPAATLIEFSIPAVSPDPIQTSLPLHGAHQLQNLGTALGVVQALLSQPPHESLNFSALLTPKAIQEGISNVHWRGRLSWHTHNARPVLVDGAHNPASSRALRHYIEEILPSKAHITYILALSHSPPKQPRDTLEPLLTPFTAPHVTTSAAFVPFTPPTGMPWVKHVPPSQLAGVSQDLLGGSESIWAPESVAVLEEGASNSCLQAALNWAASQGEGKEHLIVVAGSLYLVADFYRLHNQGLDGQA